MSKAEDAFKVWIHQARGNLGMEPSAGIGFIAGAAWAAEQCTNLLADMDPLDAESDGVKLCIARIEGE